MRLGVYFERTERREQLKGRVRMCRICDKIDEKKGEMHIERILYERWQELWRKREGDEFFLDLFKANYELISFKAKKNKRWNFFFEMIIVVMILVPYILMIIFIGSGENLLSLPALNGGIAVTVSIGMAKAIERWVYVKQFQETWVRHSQTKNKMLSEMLKYIEEMPPYEHENPFRHEKCNLIFKKNILNILNNTQNQFQKNMSRERVNLSDRSLKESVKPCKY